ncbi:membrane protein [Rugosimonospora africana]|uniref:Membrane protein n=2 Tax=Rugosimonospora africana TaxID=556532 RepID=A0A8J3QVG4_9ACTN|nr:membrane protein [Rugosimonospora africana]
MWGLLAVFGSAVCYGVASVFQAIGARRAPDSGRTVGPRILVRALRQGPFVAGVALDGGGFVFQLIALRSLPLFLVQAGQASNLAVTAVVAVPILAARLNGRQWAAVAGVCAGLALLSASAGDENPVPPGPWFGFGLLVSVLALTALGLAVGKTGSRARPAILGSVAGLGFGITALAARGLTDWSPAYLVRDPAAWSLAVGGVIGFLFFTGGLNSGSVTVVSAAVVVTETVVPAVVGVLVLGDHARHGFVPVAVVGFVLAVLGALLLAGSDDPTSGHPSPESRPALAER